jgi:hypothetical protein
MNEAFRTDVETMLKLVSEEMDSQFANQQTCSTETWGLKRKIFFNPGLC